LVIQVECLDYGGTRAVGVKWKRSRRLKSEELHYQTLRVSLEVKKRQVGRLGGWTK
jgi:hypothetical protein